MFGRGIAKYDGDPGFNSPEKYSCTSIFKITQVPHTTEITEKIVQKRESYGRSLFSANVSHNFIIISRLRD